MKKVRYVSAAMLGIIALAGVASADPQPASTTPQDDPTLRYDQDGIPLAVTQKQQEKATPEEIAAYRKQQAKAASDKDWLLRAYEKQLQTHDSATQYQNANPYEEISANKDLAKLAGLSDYDDANVGEKPVPHTGSDHSSPALHPASSALSRNNQPFGSEFLRPMITPLSGPSAATLNDFSSSLPFAGLSASSGNGQPPPAATFTARVSVVPDDTVDHDIDTPGMIAAEKNPLADPSTSDLTLDILPGESIDHARAHQDNNSLQLPVAFDADQLHRAQTAELGPPVPKKKGADQTAAVVPPPVKPPDDYDAPIPISQLPVINPVRPAIANPYDILNR